LDGTTDLVQPTEVLAVPVRKLARALPAALAAFALAAPASAPASASRAAAAHCANTHVMPTRSNLRIVRAALLCLHNQVRAQHGLPALKANGKLVKAAISHSANMVRRRYFDHTEPNGRTFVSRILGAGYVGHRQGWALGENIAWGTGRLATPAAIMSAWMKSPGHRANILQRSYREIGIGIKLGVPTAANSGATFTVDFGVRH
jgi:uncharacterized protein YkwD